MSTPICGRARLAVEDALTANRTPLIGPVRRPNHRAWRNRCVRPGDLAQARGYRSPRALMRAKLGPGSGVTVFCGTPSDAPGCRIPASRYRGGRSSPLAIGQGVTVEDGDRRVAPRSRRRSGRSRRPPAPRAPVERQPWRRGSSYRARARPGRNLADEVFEAHWGRFHGCEAKARGESKSGAGHNGPPRPSRRGLGGAPQDEVQCRLALANTPHSLRSARRSVFSKDAQTSIQGPETSPHSSFGCSGFFARPAWRHGGGPPLVTATLARRGSRASAVHLPHESRAGAGSPASRLASSTTA